MPAPAKNMRSSTILIVWSIVADFVSARATEATVAKSSPPVISQRRSYCVSGPDSVTLSNAHLIASGLKSPDTAIFGFRCELTFGAIP